MQVSQQQPINEKERRREDLYDYLQNCIKKNFLLILSVTSYTQGKIKSENLPFGVGKTTCAMWLNAWMNNEGWRDPEHWKDNMTWEPTKQSMFYDYTRVIRRLKRFDGIRINNLLYDDAQATAPATKNVDKKIYDLAYYLTCARPETATVTMTTSNLLMVAAPLRNIVNVEIIVPQRGIFEVQRIKNYKNFYKPRDDLSKLDYLEEGTFSELPSEIQQWYDDWRIEEKKQWHKNHPEVSGKDDEEDEAINITEDQRKTLRDLVLKGNAKTKTITDKDAIEDMILKGLVKYAERGYIIRPTPKANKLIIR